MITFKKKPQELLREEAAWRLMIVMQEVMPRQDQMDYVLEHGFGHQSQFAPFEFVWDRCELEKLKPDMLVALVKQCVLTEEQWRQGIDTRWPRHRALVRAIIDLEGTQGFNHGYDDGYQRGASLAVQRVKEWIDRRAREFVFSPASMIPALKAEVKLDDLTPET